MRVIRFLVGLLGMVAFWFAMIPSLLIPVGRVRRRYIQQMGLWWARFALWVLRVRVTVEPPGMGLSGPALIVANHSTYLDILVVMSLAPSVFVSKKAILWWPLFGQLAALGGTVFVDRRDRLSVGRLVDKIRRRLRSGSSVVFFPEATSSDGRSLLPFKSSLFGAARGEGGESYPVRPVVLRYCTVGGQPVGEANRDLVHYYGGANFLAHVWRLLGAGAIEVRAQPLEERELTGSRGEFARSLRDEMLKTFENMEPAADAGV
jgi:1-acyl-sn-glycerol-3-phosphate acyltransferase